VVVKPEGKKYAGDVGADAKIMRGTEIDFTELG
jgi:hypothetical protein